MPKHFSIWRLMRPNGPIIYKVIGNDVFNSDLLYLFVFTLYLVCDHVCISIMYLSDLLF